MVHLVINLNRCFGWNKIIFNRYSFRNQAKNDKTCNNHIGFIQYTQENQLCFGMFMGFKRGSLISRFIVWVGMRNNLSVREIVVVGVD